MPMQREQDLCSGRGFADTDANGWCAKLKDWIVKPAVNGGPGWYILKDRSTYPTAKSVSAINTTTEIITINSHGFLDGEPIKFQTAGTQIGGVTTGTKYYCKVVDSNNIKLYTTWALWMAGGTALNLTSAGSGNSAISVGPYIIVSDQQNPAALSNAKIVKIGYEISMSGYAAMQVFLTNGTLENSHPLGLWAGYPIKTVDSGAFTYDFRGNSEFLFLQSRIPAEAKWYRAGIDEFSILTDFTENDASVYGIVSGNTAYTAGSSCVLTLESEAQVNSLTKGNGYFIIYCGTDTTGLADSCNVTYGVIDQKGVADGLTATQVRFAFLPGMQALSSTIRSGSRITPYLHKMYTFSNSTSEQTQLSDFAYSYSNSTDSSFLPYMSYTYDLLPSVMFVQGGPLRSSCKASIENDIVTKGLQDDGSYIVQRPALYEYANGAGGTNGMNRVWGESKNLYCTYGGSLTDMEMGRIIDGIDFVSIGLAAAMINGLTSVYLLIQQTETV